MSWRKCLAKAAGCPMEITNNQLHSSQSWLTTVHRIQYAMAPIDKGGIAEFGAGDAMEFSRWSLTLYSGIARGSNAAVQHGSLPPSDAIMTGCTSGIVGLTKVFSFPLSNGPATGTAMVHGAGYMYAPSGAPHLPIC